MVNKGLIVAGTYNLLNYYNLNTTPAYENGVVLVITFHLN